VSSVFDPLCRSDRQVSTGIAEAKRNAEAGATAQLPVHLGRVLLHAIVGAQVCHCVA
jgi:hypothetical protein